MIIDVEECNYVCYGSPATTVNVAILSLLAMQATHVRQHREL